MLDFVHMYTYETGVYLHALVNTKVQLQTVGVAYKEHTLALLQLHIT